MVWAITAVRMQGGQHHAHITDVAWLNTDTGVKGQSTTATMVEFVSEQNKPVRVGSLNGWVAVGVVRPADGKPYLRSHADNVWSDNLLELPRLADSAG